MSGKADASCADAPHAPSANEDANDEGDGMDHGKSGTPKAGKKAPKHQEHNAKGTAKNPYGAQADRTELVARLKAAAAAKKTN